MNTILIDVVIPTLLSILITAYVLPRTRLSQFSNKYRFGSVSRNGNVVSRARYLGGASFGPVFLIAIGINTMVAIRTGLVDVTQSLSDQIGKTLQMTTGVALLYGVGLMDDIKGISVKSKFIAVLIASCLFPVSGLWINNLYGLMGLHVLSPWVGIPFTVLLMSYLIATISMTDGIEGMATGQCTISLIAVLGLSFYAQSRLSVFMCCAALGFTLTYFLSNLIFSKNRGTFLGFSGSMPLGYVICFVILCLYKNKEWHGTPDGVVLAAFCTMLMPVWDMLRVLKSRFVDRRRLGTPDRNLLYHKLMHLGLSRTSILTVIFMVNCIFIASAVFLIFHKMNITFVFLMDVVLFVLFHVLINIQIDHKTGTEHSLAWEKEYGKENWAEEEVVSDNDWDIEANVRQILEDDETPQAKANSIVAPAMESIPFIPDGMNAFERNVKRVLDFVIACISLIVFSPLFLFCFILIKMDDGGPVLYRQERLGRFGRPFIIYKFRSMRCDAEQSGPQLSHAVGELDERLTKAGRFLRQHHLDELPQLWNVFTGDMAFIGYRPERLFFIQQIVKYDPRYYMLYQIRPGVTSYATLYNGYTDTMEKMLRRLELDLYYLKHRSWWFDIKILFLTFWNIIGGKSF